MWNPAHIILYTGFLILLGTVVRVRRERDGVIRLSMTGIALSIIAAGFNEFWHRLLLFGNPRPEPFPIEPPHVLLAVGFIIAGIAALLYPLKHPHLVSNWKTRLAVYFLSGSLWLIIAGSAFFVGGTYESYPALTFAIGSSTFALSLFLMYSTSMATRFGYATLISGSYRCTT